MKRIKIFKTFAVFWLFLFFLVYSFSEEFLIFFFSTLAFNAVVLTIMVMGSAYMMGSAIKLVMLAGTFGALAYKRSGYDFYLRAIDRIMPAHIAHMFATRKDKERLLFTQEESKEVIDWLSDSFVGQKSYINFFISTALMVGLLGTFSGLLIAIDEMGGIVLGMGEGTDINEVMEKFSGPLSGMAVGFGSSLFGVMTAIILGIKAYILYRSQDQFIEGVENWLKGRIIDSTGEDIENDAMQSLENRRKSFMDVFLDQMTNFSDQIAKLGSRGHALSEISDQLQNISGHMQEERRILGNLNSGQESASRENHRLLGELSGVLGHMRRQLEQDGGSLQELVTLTQSSFDQSNTHMGAVAQATAEMSGRMEQETRILEQIVTASQEGSQASHAVLEQASDRLEQILGASRESSRYLASLQSESAQSDEAFDKALSRLIRSSEQIESRLVQERDVISQLVTLQESQAAQAGEQFDKTEAALRDIASIMERERQIMANIAGQQEGGFGDLNKGLIALSESSQTMAQRLGEENRLLETILSSQNEASGSSQAILNRLADGIDKLDGRLDREKQILISIASSQENSTKELQKSFGGLSGALGKIATSIDQEKAVLGTLGEKQDEQTRNLSGRFEELAGSLDKVQQLLGREAGLLESVRDGLDQSESFKSALEPLKGALDHALGVNTQSLQTMEQVLSAIEESGVKESDSARSIREAIEQLAKLADDQRRLLNGLSEEGREGRDVASRSATLLDEIRNQSGRMVDALEGQRLVMDGIQSESSQMKGRMGTYTQTAEEGFGSLERVLTSLLQNSRQGDEILDTLAQRQEESLQTQKALLEQMRDQAREDRRDRELMQQTLSQLTDAMRQVSKRSGGSGDSDKRGFFARLFG